MRVKPSKVIALGMKIEEGWTLLKVDPSTVDNSQTKHVNGPGSPNNLWRGLLLLSLLLLAGLVLMHRDELINVVEALKRGEWVYFTLALGLQMLFFALQSFMYKELLGIWRVNLSYAKVYLITLASTAGNRLIPSGGASGLLLFIGEASRSGVGAEVSLLANAAFYLLDYTAFLLVVIWGFWYMLRRGQLNHTEELAVTVFIGLIIIAFILFITAIKHTDRLIEFIETRLHPRIPVLLRLKNKVVKSLVNSRLVEKSWSRARGKAALAFLAGIGLQLIDIAILFLSFMVVSYSADPGMLVAVFGLSAILSLASMVPQGIGIYEAAMTWLFHQMGIPFGIALSVALIYRGVTFWFPILPGIISMKLIGRKLL